MHQNGLDHRAVSPSSVPAPLGEMQEVRAMTVAG